MGSNSLKAKMLGLGWIEVKVLDSMDFEIYESEFTMLTTNRDDALPGSDINSRIFLSIDWYADQCKQHFKEWVDTNAEQDDKETVKRTFRVLENTVIEGKGVLDIAGNRLWREAVCIRLEWFGKDHDLDDTEIIDMLSYKQVYRRYIILLSDTINRSMIYRSETQ